MPAQAVIQHWVSAFAVTIRLSQWIRGGAGVAISRYNRQTYEQIT
jgi:hypothetical protein